MEKSKEKEIRFTIPVEQSVLDAHLGGLALILVATRGSDSFDAIKGRRQALRTCDAILDHYPNGMHRDIGGDYGD